MQSSKIRRKIMGMTICYPVTFAITAPFIPVYLSDACKFNEQQIGILMGVGPIMAILASWFWGKKADTAKYKNNVLALLNMGAIISSLLFLASKNFIYIAVVMVVFYFFQVPMMPINDSICMEACLKYKWNYGNFRIGGSFTYGMMSVFIGFAFGSRISDIFWVYALVVALWLYLTMTTEKVAGYQGKKEEGSKLSYFSLFEDKMLAALFILCFVVFITIGFFYTFFSVYYISPAVGGTKGMLGVCTALAALSEIPFYLASSKLVRRFSIEKVIAGSVFVMAARWFLIGMLRDPVAILIANLLHGFSYNALYFASISYINSRVRPELRASGQAFNTMTLYGFSRIIGSMGCGYLAKWVPLSGIFVICSALCFAVGIAYSVLIYTDAKAHPAGKTVEQIS